MDDGALTPLVVTAYREILYLTPGAKPEAKPEKNYIILKYIIYFANMKISSQLQS